MFSEKLLSLLQTFSKYELNRFRKYLLSPYLNDQTELVRLFDCCNAALRKGPENLEALEKKAVWQAVFAEKTYDDTTFRRLSSDLTNAAIQFLVLEKRAQRPLDNLVDTLAALESPTLEKHRAGVERQIGKMLEATPSKSADFYWANFRLHELEFERASKVVANTGYAEKLLPADFYLDCFYIVQKLKFYVGWLLFRGFWASEKEFSPIADFLQYAENERFANIPLVFIYRQIIFCLTQPEQEEHYRLLMAGLETHGGELAEEDLRDCLHIAQNYCALKINQGRNEYFREIFEVNNKMMARGLLLENGSLSEGLYKNIITTSLGLGEFAWAENFVREYSQYLPPQIRENAMAYNLAHIYFSQKQYGRAIELLRNVEYHDVTYTLSAKTLLLRTYYESGEYIALDSLIESFRIFLRRNRRISQNTLRECNNFLNFLKKLVNMGPVAASELESLRRKVNETESVIAKKWLLEKLSELQKNRRSD